VPLPDKNSTISGDFSYYEKSPQFEVILIIATIDLTFARFNFVTTEVFLSFGVNSVFTSDWVVFFNTQFFLSIHGVFGGVISAVTSQLTHQTNQLAFAILFGHYIPSYFLKILSYYSIF
jgi:hypothetical protein